MSTIQLPGLSTGIDTSTLIQQLMAIEKRTLNMWESRKTVLEEKQGALSTLKTDLSGLRSAVRELSDYDELKSFAVSTSDEDCLTAEANSDAFEGSHNVVINQLANAERWVHTTGHEYKEDYVGAGTFIYSYNYKETSITTTATTTLQELVNLINNDSNNPGVTAGLLYYNEAYHLVLNGEDAGTDYEIKVNSSSTEVWKSGSVLTDNNDNVTLSTKIKDIDTLTGTHTESDYIRITGTDHFGVSIGNFDLTITDDMTVGHLISEINDAFDGRAQAVLEKGKIVLTDSENDLSNISLSLTYNGVHATDPASLDLSMGVSTEGAATAASLAGYAESNFTLSQAAQDSQIKVDGFPNTSAASEVQTVSLDAAPEGGTYTLTYRGETTSAINYDDGAATIQAALEALSTVNPGDITVSGALANGTTFTFNNALGNVDLLMIDGSGLTGPSTCSIAQTTAGSDGYISRSSNTIDDVISGVTLHLYNTTDESGEDITLTRDIQSVKSKINDLVTAYNTVVENIKEVTGYDEATEEAGILMGNYVVSTIRYQIRSPLIEQASGFLEDVDTFLIPLNIGLELDKDGVLSFDENDFDQAVAEDYTGVLELIGANKIGTSTSDDIKFYAATDYTTAGTYNVRVNTVDGSVSSVQIKLSSESSYRNMSYADGIATGISTLNDDNGYPDYAECGLQLSIDESNLTGTGTYETTIYVKQGFTGKIEGALDKMLKAGVGSVSIDEDYMEKQIEYIEKKIEDEEYRLEKREERLVLQFARLEETLTLIQGQLSAAGLLSLSSD